MDDHSSTDAPQLAYAGGAEEANSGCYYLGGRLYSPAMRRFACADPFSPFDEGGLNRYAYCGGDPIGRIDPTGNAWWDWLVAGVGLVVAIVGTVATAGAMAGVVGAAAAGSLTASMSTASSISMATAAVLDVVSVGTEIAATVSMASGNEKAALVLGWVAMGMGGVSASAGIAGWRAASSTRRALANSSEARATMVSARRRPLRMDARAPTAGQAAGTPHPPIRISNPAELDAERFVVRFDHRTLQSETWVVPRWHRFESARMPGVHHFAADMAITGDDVEADLVGLLAPFGSATVHHHSGAHGFAHGQNYLGGRRLNGDFSLFDEDRAHQAVTQSLAGGRRVVFHNLATLSESEALSLFRQPGVHIHAYCFGAADAGLRDLLRIAPVPVYVGPNPLPH
ncbi:MAG: RHS repeat-associated core domain-containing protein [Sphingobium sp.]